MPKYYKKHAQGRRTDKPDLRGAVSNFVQQQDQTVRAAKEQNLRIKQNEQRWLNEDEKSQRKSLENLQDLNNLKSQAAATRSKAIRVRRDTEVDKLEEEARQAEEMSKHYLNFSRTASNEFLQVAQKIGLKIDHHNQKKVFQELDKENQLDLLEQTQIFKNNIGQQALKEADIKIKAIEKGDYEGFNYVVYRGKRVRNNDILYSHYVDNEASIIQSFHRHIQSFPPDEQIDKNHLRDLFVIRGRELAAQMGLDPLSEQGLKIINKWRALGTSAKATIANYDLAANRAEDWKNNTAIFKVSPTQVNLDNFIIDDLRGNYEWNAKTNEFNLKPKDYQVSIKETGLKAFEEIAKFDKYHTLGKQEGWEAFREDTIYQYTPTKAPDKPIPWITRHPDIEQELAQIWTDAVKARTDKLNENKTVTDETFATNIEIRTNPNHPNYDPDNAIDTSTKEGVMELAKLYDSAPGTKSTDAITKALDYDIGDANYSIDKHIKLLDASITDPVGFHYLSRNLSPEDRKKYANKSKVAKTLEIMGLNHDSIEDYFKGVIEDYVLNDHLTLDLKLHKSTEKQIEETSQTFVFNLQQNLHRLETEFMNDFENYGDAILEETAASVKDTKLNPIIEVGDIEGFPGQETVLFAKQYKRKAQTPKTYKDWHSMLTNSYNKETKEHEMNIQDLIDKGEILTPQQTIDLVREIEQGGGGDNNITLSGDLKRLADLEKKWTARGIVNAHLEKQGLKHRLPPDTYTMVTWYGYEGKKPSSMDVKAVEMMHYLKGIEGVPLPEPLRRKTLPQDTLAQSRQFYNPVTRTREDNFT